MYCTTKEEYLSIEKMKKMKNVEKIKIICVWVKLNENKSLNKQI